MSVYNRKERNTLFNLYAISIMLLAITPISLPFSPLLVILTAFFAIMTPIFLKVSLATYHKELGYELESENDKSCIERHILSFCKSFNKLTEPLTRFFHKTDPKRANINYGYKFYIIYHLIILTSLFIGIHFLPFKLALALAYLATIFYIDTFIQKIIIPETTIHQAKPEQASVLKIAFQPVPDRQDKTLEIEASAEFSSQLSM